MKRLIVITMVVLMVLSSQALARPHRDWRDSDFRGVKSYGYGYDGGGYYNGGYYNGGYYNGGYYDGGRGGSLLDLLYGQTRNRELDMAEKEQEFQHQQEQTKANRGEEKTLFETADLRGKVQKLEDENQKLQEKISQLEQKINKLLAAKANK